MLFLTSQTQCMQTKQLCGCPTYHTKRVVLIRSLRPTAVSFISPTTVNLLSWECIESCLSHSAAGIAVSVKFEIYNWDTYWDAWKGPALCQQHFQMAFLSWKIIPSRYEFGDLINCKSGNGLVLSDNKTKSEPQLSRLVTPYGVTTLQRVKLWTDKLMDRYIRPFTLYKQLSKKKTLLTPYEQQIRNTSHVNRYIGH